MGEWLRVAIGLGILAGGYFAMGAVLIVGVALMGRMQRRAETKGRRRG